jgi:pimeloyl-ACP methyl ester carboxylesterase
MAVATTTVTRSFVDVPAGTIHVAQAGTGKHVLLLHQTPRSWDEYRDVVPLLGESFHAIAMDTIGFGDSSKPRGDEPDTIEMWAEVAISLLDALGVERASVIGHHTGAVIAMEIAAAFPDRVDKLVLSAPAMVDDEHRRLYGDKPPVDEVERKLDGSHLVELWSMRAPFYPKDIDLLERFVIDALKAGNRSGGGHLTVARYDMEPKLPLITCPTLIIKPTADPFAAPEAEKLAPHLPHAETVDLPGGMIPAPDQLPEDFARIVTEYLSKP